MPPPTTIRLRARAAWLVPALATALLLGPVAARATTPIPYSATVRHSVEETFLEDGSPSPEKIGIYREFLKDKRKWIEQHSYDFRRRVQGQGKKKARRRAESSDETVTLGYALDLLKQLEKSTDPATTYRLGAHILTLDYATRSFHYPLATIQMPIYMKNMLSDWSADGTTRPGDGPEEASNLVDPETGEFLTADELDAMIERGEDISRLDPPSDGMLWRSTGDISKLDIVEHYLGGHIPMHEGLPSVFPPDGARTQLRRLQLTQTKPKLRVYWSDEECSQKSEEEQEDCRELYSLRIGNELHADPVVNSLMAAIGYNSDISVHRKNIRVDLGEVTYEEVRRDWTNYFDVQHLWTRVDLDYALLPGDEGHSTDEHGEYLVFRAGGMESRPGPLNRMGDYSNGLIAPDAITTGMREARALFLFNAWVANTDLKDAENNKLLLRRDEATGEWRMFMAQQDSGNSLGLVLAEKADAYPWNVVETNWIERGFGAVRGRVELNYFALQNTGMYDTATHADHRWMVRLIAQLTREQIEAAVALGRFPGGVGQLYVEKLINRRNQLVEAFGLSDEFDPIPVDRHITTEDGSVVDGRLVQGYFPDETIVNLGEHWRSLVRPIGPALWRQIRRWTAQGIGAFDSAGGQVSITSDLDLFPELLFNVARFVVANPNSRSELDKFIVEDTMTMGGRLGIGHIAHVRGTIRRQYRLSYTVPTAWDGKLHDNQALNWLLPRDIRRSDLPEEFTVLRTDQFGPGGAVTTSDPLDFTPGADAALDWLWTRRTAISRRAGETLAWLDRGETMRAEGRLWLKFWVPRLTLVRGVFERGHLGGDLYRPEGPLDSDDLVSRILDDGGEAFAGMAQEPPRATDVRFRDWSRDVNLLFVRWRGRDRREWIELGGGEAPAPATKYQYSKRRHARWIFLDNGESFRHLVKGFLDEGFSDAEESGATVVASYLIDDLNAVSHELDAYQRFLAGLAGDRRILADPFRAEDWHQTGEPDGRWGRLLVEGQLVLRDAALDALAQLDEAAYWPGLAEHLGMPVSELLAIRDGLAGSHGSRTRLRLRTPRRIAAPIDRSRRVLRALARARLAETPEKRIDWLTTALHRASLRRGGSFDVAVLETVLRQIGFEQLAEDEMAGARVRIRKAFEDEVIFPDGRDMAGQRGERQLQEHLDVVVDPFDTIELHRMLDWAWGEPTTYFIAPGPLRRPVR